MFTYVGTKTLMRYEFNTGKLVYGGMLHTIRDNEKKLNIDIFIQTNQIRFNAEYDSGRTAIKELEKRVFIFNRQRADKIFADDELGIQMEYFYSPYVMKHNHRILKLLSSIPSSLIQKLIIISIGV